MLPSRTVHVAVTALALAPLSGAGTLTVGPAGSGAQFTQIQAAVDAALPDDVILVKPGTYARIDVNKPLRILGDGILVPGPKTGADGGFGIQAEGSRVNLFGGPSSEVTGGRGVYDSAVDWNHAGGVGIALLQGSSARIQASIPVTGGLDGLGTVRAQPFLVDATSSHALDPKVFPTLASSAQQVRIGSTFQLTHNGNPGGYQVLFLSVRTGPTSTTRGVDGFGLLDRGNLFQLATGVLPASGTHTTTFRVPNVAGLLGTTLFLQTAERFPNPGPPAGFALGNPVLVTITG